jgi:hypothetical protein
MMPDPFKPSQAGIDLGMGVQLQQQVMSQILERRKKAMIAATQPAPAYGALALGPGTSGQGNTGGLALQALLGQGISGG